jgi:hypothetical protein
MTDAEFWELVNAVEQTAQRFAEIDARVRIPRAGPADAPESESR